MNLVFTLTALLALAALCAFLIRFCSVPSGLAPLTGVCLIMLYFSLAGCLNVLYPAGWLFYALCAAGGVLCLLRRPAKARPLFSTGLLAFGILSLFFLLLFAWKQPLYTTWDEYSFWGTATKLMKSSNQLYTVAKVGWTWPATQKPGLIALTYFFEFFGSYAPWRALFAYDVLLTAGFCAVIALLENKKWPVAVPAFGICLLLPYVCVLYRTLQIPSYVYMTTLSDVPMGVLFGGVLCAGFALSREPAGRWPLLVMLAALTFVRDTAFPLALIAALILTVDLVFCQKTYRFGRLSSGASKAALGTSLFAVPCLFFVLWVLYLKLALRVDAVGNIGGTETMSMFEMLRQGVLQLFGIGRTEKYAFVMGNMLRSFWSLRMTAIGSGLRVVILIAVLLAAAFLFSDDRVHRRRCVLFAVCSAVGFAAFYLFNGFCYAFIFKENEYTTLVGYERYLFPYYLAWLMGAVCLLAATAAGKHRLVPGAAALGLFGVLALFAWKVSGYLTPGYSFLDYTKGSFYENYQILGKAQEVQQTLGETQNEIFFVSQGDDGARWFEYSCAMLPLQVNYSFGGGTICLPGDAPEGTAYHIFLTPEELCEYVQKEDCRYVLIDRIDETFIEEYGALFDDGLAAAREESALYRVVSMGDGFCFEIMGTVCAQKGA